jgi:RHS repeat-associated protein
MLASSINEVFTMRMDTAQRNNDAAGNVTAITDTLNSGQVQAFTYDELNRLTAASTSGGGEGTYNRNWTYGQTGNITSADGNAYSYDTLHPHAVSSVVSGASYVYDLNGNATTITPTTGAARLLSYDYENRLISTAGAVTMQLSYDGDGQRVLKQDGSTATRYIGAWSEISVTAGTTTTTNYYWFAGRRVAMKVGSAVTYLYADQLGSTVKTTGNQTTVERYEPYGAKRGTDTVSTPYRYTGQREEETLGLYDYGARWYDPSIGRFLQADSIAADPKNPQSNNRYSYALNNPLRYADPTGHTVVDALPPVGIGSSGIPQISPGLRSWIISMVVAVEGFVAQKPQYLDPLSQAIQLFIANVWYEPDAGFMFGGNEGSGLNPNGIDPRKWLEKSEEGVNGAHALKKHGVDASLENLMTISKSPPGRGVPQTKFTSYTEMANSISDVLEINKADIFERSLGEAGIRTYIGSSASYEGYLDGIYI